MKAFALTRSGDLRGSRSKADAHRAGPQGSSSGAVKQEVEGTCFRNTPVVVVGFFAGLQPFCPFRATREKKIRKPVGSPLNHAGQI